MIEEYAGSLQGIDVLGIAGLILSFLFFCAIVVWASRMDKSYLRTMAGLPLDVDDSELPDSKD
jgi:hypothetical protein